MTEEEFNTRASYAVIAWMLVFFMCLGLIKAVQPDTPAYFLDRYNRAVVEEQKRHNAEKIRHNIALYGEQK